MNCKNVLAKLLVIPLTALGAISCEMNSMEEPLLSDQLENENNQSAADQNGANLRIGQNYIFEETFEGSRPFSTAHGPEIGADHSVTFVDRPGSSNNTAARFELRYDDPDVKGSRRAEWTIVKGENGDIKKDTWYSFEVYVPNSYIDESDEEVINQWHQDGNASASIRIENGRFLWRFYINGNKIDTDLGRIEKDTWNSVVVHMVHSYNSDGVTEVWINGRKLMDQKGRNINNDPLPKWKIGIYKSEWEDGRTNTTRRVLYFDNVRVGNENATYEEMQAGFGNGGTVTPPVIQPEEQTPVTQPDAQPDLSDSGSGIGSLTFVNAQYESDIYSLTDGSRLSLEEQGTYKINIRADIQSSAVKSVKFELSGSKSHTYIDNAEPYALFGDDSNGNYYYGPGMSPGNYTLRITSYSDIKGRGTALGSREVKFTIDR